MSAVSPGGNKSDFSVNQSSGPPKVTSEKQKAETTEKTEITISDFEEADRKQLKYLESEIKDTTGIRDRFKEDPGMFKHYDKEVDKLLQKKYQLLDELTIKKAENKKNMIADLKLNKNIDKIVEKFSEVSKLSDKDIEKHSTEKNRADLETTLFLISVMKDIKDDFELGKIYILKNPKGNEKQQKFQIKSQYDKILTALTNVREKLIKSLPPPLSPLRPLPGYRP